VITFNKKLIIIRRLSLQLEYSFRFLSLIIGQLNPKEYTRNRIKNNKHLIIISSDWWINLDLPRIQLYFDYRTIVVIWRSFTLFNSRVHFWTVPTANKLRRLKSFMELHKIFKYYLLLLSNYNLIKIIINPLVVIFQFRNGH